MFIYLMLFVYIGRKGKDIFPSNVCPNGQGSVVQSKFIVTCTIS